MGDPGDDIGGRLTKGVRTQETLLEIGGAEPEAGFGRERERERGLVDFVDESTRKAKEQSETTNSTQLEEQDQAYLKMVIRTLHTANNGCLRGAKQILVGSAQANPSHAPTRQIQNKLSADDLDENSWSEM